MIPRNINESAYKQFSMLVPHHVYRELLKMSKTMNSPLGAICRTLLEVVDFKMFNRLQSIAFKKQIPLATLMREIIYEGVTARERK